VAHLAAKIVLVAQNPHLRAMIGANARASAASHATDGVAAAYARLLRAVGAAGLSRARGHGSGSEVAAYHVPVDREASIPGVVGEDVRDGGVAVPYSMGRRLDHVG
jgi:hypothetical protein